MKKYVVIIAIITAVLLFASLLPAQEGRGEGRLRGIVYDKDKTPIEGVKLTLVYQEYTNTLEAVTNKKGQFGFIGLARGMVRITAEKEGYVTAGIQTTVSGVKRNPLQYITLEKEQAVAAVPEEAAPAEETRKKFSQANSLFEAGDFNKALDLYREFRDSQPKMYKIGLNIGNCLIKLGQFDEAVSEFLGVMEKIKQESPDLKGNQEASRIYASIGDAYMRQDKFKEAEEYFKKSMEIDVSDHALPYNVGEILFVAGKTDEALKYYEKAIEINPKFEKSYKQAGYAYLNKGDVAKAKTLFRKFLELAPNHPEADAIKEVLKSL